MIGVSTHISVITETRCMNSFLGKLQLQLENIYFTNVMTSQNSSQQNERTLRKTWTKYIEINGDYICIDLYICWIVCKDFASQVFPLFSIFVFHLSLWFVFLEININRYGLIRHAENYKPGLDYSSEAHEHTSFIQVNMFDLISKFWKHLTLLFYFIGHGLACLLFTK